MNKTNTTTTTTNNNTASRIDAARKNIRESAPGYWEATVASRTAETAVGSFFKFPKVEEVLFEQHLQDWEEYPECPGLLPCQSSISTFINGIGTGEYCIAVVCRDRSYTGG